MIGPAVSWLNDIQSLHLSEGPIDLIVHCEGERDAVTDAYCLIEKEFASILTVLVDELHTLRAPLGVDTSQLNGPVARLMQQACVPFCAYDISAMAAVAGAVADYLLDTIVSAPGISRAWINNGGDIAVHLTPGEVFDCGVIGSLQTAQGIGTIRLHAADGIGGIATSGQAMSAQGGRSFSLGIADSVTVLAKNAATADVAATVIANHVDLPGHDSIVRVPANTLDPDSDLRERAVTTAVGELHPEEVAHALQRGASLAYRFLKRGLLNQVFLSLRGQSLAIVSADQCKLPVRTLASSGYSSEVMRDTG